MEHTIRWIVKHTVVVTSKQSVIYLTYVHTEGVIILLLLKFNTWHQEFVLYISSPLVDTKCERFILDNIVIGI